MVSIIANCVIFLCTLASISQITEFCNTYKRTDIKLFRYNLLGLSVALTCCCNVAMLFSYGTVVCYFFFAIERFARTLFMVELVLVAENILKSPPKFVSMLISVISYASLALYFVDTIISGGILGKSRFGVFLRPQSPLHKILHFAFYMLYIIAMLALVVFRATFVSKKKEKYELYLLLGSYGVSCFGLLAELFITVYSMTYIPLCTLCNLISIIFMLYLIKYHRSIMLIEEDFSQDLAPNRVDAVFILDDNFKVVFLNQRARILSNIYHDNYLGRKFTDIFDFTDEKIAEIKSADDHAPFGLSADYPLASRSVSMVVRHAFDKFGRIFYTTVIVYNMEEQAQYTDNETYEQQIGDDEKKVRAESVAITSGARVMLVDEDVLFLREFQNILIPYDVEITRALNGNDAIDLIKKTTFDIVFISEKMIRLPGFETATKIRSLPGEYYNDVPLVLVTENDINSIYTDFLNSGCTDYLNKPITPKQINSVLTRWVWKRYDRDTGLDTDDGFDVKCARERELTTLISDAKQFLLSQKNDKLQFCIKGINKCCALLGITAASDVAFELEEASLFDDEETIGALLDKMTSLTKDF